MIKRRRWNNEPAPALQPRARAEVSGRSTWDPAPAQVRGKRNQAAAQVRGKRVQIAASIQDLHISS